MSLRHRTAYGFSLLLPIWASITFQTRLAHADVSSWLSVSTGVYQVHSLDFDRPLIPAFRLGTGMGTDPSHRFVVGGMARVDTLFGKGTDLSFLVRLADHGFVNGDWGFAMDVGPTARFWGSDAYGGAAVATLGIPWGFELGINGNFGTEHVRSYGCFVGLDLARLTVYRRSGSSWWKNSFPAYRTPEEQSH